MKNTLTKPKNLIIAFGIMFLLNLIIFSQTPSPTPAPKDLSLMDGMSSIGSVITFILLVFNFVVVLAGVVWWVFWGRDKEQLKERADGWKDTAERYRTENAELKTKDTEKTAKIKELRSQRRKDRDLFYLLVARLEGQNIDIKDVEDLWEEI